MSMTTVLLTLVLFVVGCAPASHDGDPRRDGWGLFSNRPQTYERYLAVVRLKRPALNTMSYLAPNGSRMVNAAARTALEAEQTAFIKQLQALSPNIKILYTYKYILNAVAIEVPAELKYKIEGLGTAVHIERTGFVMPPQSIKETESEPDRRGDLIDLRLAKNRLQENNPVRLIGAEQLHRRAVPITGKGIKIGILDSGVDYTHAMFKGPGTVSSFRSVDPSASTNLFPNSVVVGGRDFSGDEFNPELQAIDSFLPKADLNPIDLTEHGTHVAGIIAGRGDGVTLPTGVAPGADIYALKVFGRGATSDVVVLAAMEYAMDPNEDGDIDDRLDILNLSLGYLFGSATGLFSEAISNLAIAGIATVTTSGNDGNIPYVTSHPGTVTPAISVAASVDDSALNIRVPSVQFSAPTIGQSFDPRVEGTISTPLASVQSSVEGKLVDIGLATGPLSKELAERVKGNIALIARGGASFSIKLSVAKDAGAIGVVMTNTGPDQPFPMGGDMPVDIPAVMVDEMRGVQLRLLLRSQEVRANLNSPIDHERLDLIDQIAEFSSAGPRSGDSAIKPELAAPGQNIISASSGTGNRLMSLSGTSMAGPFVAGALALVKQAHPTLSVNELKNLLMGRSQRMKGSVTRHGAGRLAVHRSVDSPVVIDRASFSFGRMDLRDQRTWDESIEIKNLTGEKLEYRYDFDTSNLQFQLLNPGVVNLAPWESKRLRLRFRVTAVPSDEPHTFLEGYFRLLDGAAEVYHIPALVVVRRVSEMKADAGKTSATITNGGRHPGKALLFNLLGQDAKKKAPKAVCDLQAVGYRIVERNLGRNESDAATQYLQVAIKLYQPMTTFHFCEASVLIDLDGDGKADQELGLAALGRVEGFNIFKEPDYSFSSLLVDAATMRGIRRKTEQKVTTLGRTAESDYVPALIEMLPADVADHTSVMVLEARLEHIGQNEVAIQVATIQSDAVDEEGEDYLGDAGWMKLSLRPESQSFMDLPEDLRLEPGEAKKIRLSRGEGLSELMILYPQNHSSAMQLIRF